MDPKAFGEELAEIVKASQAPLLARIDDLEKRLAALPEPRDGKDADPEAITAAVVKSLPLPVTQAEIEAMVAEAVAALPTPADGKDGADGRDGDKGDAGDKGTDGADGIGLAGAIIDRSGALVVTLTNGQTRELGPVVGRDGEKGNDGKDGADGVGFDDMDLEYDGERGFTFRFTKGERIVEKAFTLPVPIYRDVFVDGKTYDPADSVTFGGSVWIARKQTDEKPGTGDGWRLSVKKGRDGKDAKDA